MCCRTLYSHPGGVVTVKNTLFAVKHGFAYALCCTPRRPRRSYIKRRPCRLLYWEGKQRVEPVGIIFSRDDFSKQHQKLSFWGFGVAEEERTGDKIDEWQIDGFHSSAEEKNKRDAHKVFFYVSRVWESYLWQMEPLASTFPCTSDHSSGFSNSGCSSAFYWASWTNIRDRRTRKSSVCLNADVLLYVQRSQKCRMKCF